MHPAPNRFSTHPRRRGLAALSIAIYVNFFSHHYIVDLRWLLFAHRREAQGIAVLRTRTAI